MGPGPPCWVLAWTPHRTLWGKQRKESGPCRQGCDANLPTHQLPTPHQGDSRPLLGCHMMLQGPSLERPGACPTFLWAP